MESSDPEDTTSVDLETDHAFSPRGIMVFLAVMLTVFVIYWFYMWYTVIIVRGVGG